MTDSVYKVIELIGSSSESWEKATANAVETASKSLRDLRKAEVVLKVAPAAAGYFLRRKLIDGQKAVKELEDGGLIVSGRIAHPNQILPIVRYWIPNVKVISPEGLQTELDSQLRAYLNDP